MNLIKAQASLQTTFQNEGMIMKQKFQCEVCEEVYNTPEEALECEARVDDFADPFKPGDIVVTGQVFGWYDGDPLWIATKKQASLGESYDGFHYNFFYVVTAITPHPQRPHSVLVHCETCAMTGKQGYKGGWTSKGHYKIKKVEAPEEVVKQGQRLLGNTFDSLL